MRPVSVTQTGVGTSAGVPVDIYSPNNNKGVFVDVTGTATYTVQVTGDDVFDPLVVPVWLNVDSVANANLTNATTDQSGIIAIPCRAIRVNQTAGTGSSKLTVIQQGLL